MSRADRLLLRVLAAALMAVVVASWLAFPAPIDEASSIPVHRVSTPAGPIGPSMGAIAGRLHASLGIRYRRAALRAMAWAAVRRDWASVAASTRSDTERAALEAAHDRAILLAVRAAQSQTAQMAVRQANGEAAYLVHAQVLEDLHNDFRLHAVGSQLYTAWNAPVTLKAINWYGFEYAPFVPDGLDRQPLDTILSSLHDLGFNALRLTFADQTVRENPVVTQGLDANPTMRGLHSLDIMQRIIQRAHHFGLRVILCNSRSEAGGGPEQISGLWYTRAYSAATWEADWITLARRFRHESAFVGADLRNEPHITGSQFDENAYAGLGPQWGPYRGVEHPNLDWRATAQKMGDELLAIDPHLLIVVEGVQVYVNPANGVVTSGLWGSNLIGVRHDPIVLSRPGQLVYSVHEYGPQMWEGDWFNTKTTFQSLSQRWDHLWGYLAGASKALQAPVFVGEFGTCHEYYACTHGTQGWKQGYWFKSFVRYLAAHPQIGWAYWALNSEGPFTRNQVDYYSLVSLDWKHYFPLVTSGLAPLLSEPSGLWKVAPGTSALTPQPGCVGPSSCSPSVTESLRQQAELGVSTATGQTSPTPATSVRVETNVPYTDAENPEQAGDLYLPQGASAEPRPALLLLHGGTWDQGGRGPASAALAKTLARHGYVVYDIDYRLVSQGGYFPRDIRDVKAAAAYLAANAFTLDIDPAKIGAVGAGAGGYLAVMAAYAPSDDHFLLPGDLDPPARIGAVVSLFAPTDLAHLAQTTHDPATRAALHGYLRGSYATEQGRYHRASATTWMDTSVASIFFQGRNDLQAPMTQTFRLYRYLKERHRVAKLVDLAHAPHGLDALQGPRGPQIIGQMETFLDGMFYRAHVVKKH